MLPITLYLMVNVSLTYKRFPYFEHIHLFEQGDQKLYSKWCSTTKKHEKREKIDPTQRENITQTNLYMF